LKGSGDQLLDHEDLVGHVVLAPEAVADRGHEAEPRVVLRVPQDDDRGKPFLSAFFETGPDQGRFLQHCLRIAEDG